jgi:acetolactate synthase I/III small subunit
MSAGSGHTPPTSSRLPRQSRPMTGPIDMHTFSLVVRDHPGVLVRIALVFSRRGFNIESLAVSPGLTDGFARMTIVSRGAPETVEQMNKQLAKLVDVVFVTDHAGEQPVEAEIALLKVRVNGETEKRALLSRLERHRTRVVDETTGSIVLVADGTSAELDALINAVDPQQLEELIRTGKIVMDRGASRFAHLLGRHR